MTVIDAKEAYAIFISSDFWKALSLQCRTAAGFKCNRCGKLDHCQAHHTFYRQNWFDTQLSDLECVCAECHQKHHQVPAPKPIVHHKKKKKHRNIQWDRSGNIISGRKKKGGKYARKKWKKAYKALFKNHGKGLNTRPIYHYRNYGNSSN